jgi:uncharacterized membrane protein YphA (DoxX/SURF4 family)
LVCRWIVAAAFLMSGVTKVTDLRGFADELILRSPLPYTLAVIAAAFLPWLELTCGLCLALGYAVREAAVLLCGLLVLFLCYSATHMSADECGCFLFPKLATLPSWWLLVRDALLLACAVMVAARSTA